MLVTERFPILTWPKAKTCLDEEEKDPRSNSLGRSVSYHEVVCEVTQA